MAKKVSRRDFLKGSIAGAASVAAMGILGGCGNQDAGTTTVGTEAGTKAPETTEAPVAETKPITYADTICWNGEFDVIVVGHGAAGLTSAITAADAGAKVLIVEKADKGHAGGNSKVCHQLFATVDTVEGGMKYYSSMRGNFKSTSDEVLKTYVTGMTGLRDYLAGLGADKEKMTCWRGCGIATYDCEHPELEGSEHFFAYTLTDKVEDGALYSLLRKNVKDRAASIDVYYETPAKHLIQDPVSKAIIGVTVERGGQTLNLRALNGVILACGGFENNERMLEDYLYLGGQYHHYGTDYNTGDGITMAMEIGANLWHMANYEATGISNMYPAPGEDLFYMLAGNPAYGATLWVGPDGTRFVNEDNLNQQRHGSIYYAGSWLKPRNPEKVYGIFDDAKIGTMQVTDYMAYYTNSPYLHKADTIEELADKLKMPYLAESVEIFNRYCKEGKDEQFRRTTLIPFGAGPYYAYEFPRHAILNTQGGPQRNEKAQIVGLDGNPIPHLYSAGELGGVTAHTYQGGGNIAECLVFGQIAGTNAAAAKEALPQYAAAAVENNITHAFGTYNDLLAETEYEFELGENEYLGVSQNGMGGDVVVKVKMDGDKIAAIEVLQHSETPGTSDPAFASVPTAIIDAQSTNVDVATGATISSKALMEAVQNALDSMKK